MELYRVNTRTYDQSIGSLVAFNCDYYPRRDRCPGNMFWGTNYADTNQIKSTNLIIIGGMRYDTQGAIISSRDITTIKLVELRQENSDLLGMCVDELPN